jgi:hypothetical protein
MAQNPANVTNPGCTNVADQGDGLLSVDQTVTVTPSTSAGAANIATSSSVLGGRPTDVTDPNDARPVVEVFGTGLPKNVFVP